MQVTPALTSFFLAAGGTSALAASAATFALAQSLAYATTTFLLNKAVSSVLKQGKTGQTRGMEVSIADSTADARVIYGEVRTGGINIIPSWTSGNDGEILHQVLALAMHEIDSYQEYYFNQDALPTPTSITGAATDGLITSGDFDDVAWVRGYRGTMTQNVDYILNTAFPTQWPSTSRMRGFPYVALAYDWADGKKYKGGFPPATFKVRGAKVYDPRLDTTNGGSGSHRYTDPTTWAWSSNPALCWANYRTASLYGFGLDPATEIDWPTVITAADICDASVANKAGGTRARYTCNGILINAPERLRDNARAIIDSMFGRETNVNGKWQCYAGAWTAASYTIEKTDWLSIDDIQTVGGRDAGRHNEVHCFYPDPTRNWQRVECYPRRNTTYLSNDAAERIAVEMEQPMCTDESEAQMKAEFLLRSSRNGVKLVGRLPPRFYKLKPYDVVALNFAELQWTSKTFRIVAMTQYSDGSSDVALTEEQEADWDDLATGDYGTVSIIAAPAVNPTKPSAPQNFAVYSLDGMLNFKFDEPVVVPSGTRYRIVTATNCSDAYGATTVWEGQDRNVLLPSSLASVNSGQWWWAQAYVGSLSSLYSPNTYGKFAVPAPVAEKYTPMGASDAQFRSGLLVGSYWVTNAPAYANSISPYGGVNSSYQGKIIVTGSINYGGANWKHFSICKRTPYTPTSYSNGYWEAAIYAGPGRWLNFNVVARRTSALNGLNIDGVTLTTTAGFNIGAEYGGYVGDFAGRTAPTYVRMDNTTLDEWVTLTHSVVLPGSGAYLAVPYLIFGSYQLGAGTIEVGHFDVRVT